MKVNFSAKAVQLGLLIALLIVPSADAQHSGTEIVNDLKPVLDCQTISLVNIPLGEFKIDDSVQSLLESINDVPANTARQAQIQAEYFQKVSGKLAKAGAIDINVISRLGTLIEQESLIAVRCKDPDAAAKVSKRLDRVHVGFYHNTVKENLVLLGWDKAFLSLPRIEKNQLQTIARSLDEVGDSPIRMAFTMSPDQKKALIAGDGKSWGVDTPASINNFRHFSVGLDIQSRRFGAKMQCVDAASSVAIADRIKQSLNRLGSLKDVKRNLPSMSEWLSNVELSIANDRIELEVEVERFEAMLKALSQPLLQMLKRQKYSEETARAREIAVGFLRYEAEHGSFPPSCSVDEKGRPMHSWRVLILPYIEQRNLYNEFRMSEPWDSPHNLKAAENSPVNYVINDAKIVDGKLHTRILAMVSDDSAIRPKKTKIAQIIDGTVSTASIAIGSEEQAVMWTQPNDVKGTPDAIAAKMIEANPDGFWVATCDSGVHFVPPKADKEKLSWAFQINDGNLLSTNGDLLSEALAGPDAPDPMFDPSGLVPGWWTDYLIPVPWIEGAAISN